MSSLDHDDSQVHDHGDNVWEEGATPSFDNGEATDVLDEGHEVPLDVVEKSPGDQPVKKKSNAAFYGAVGAFALAAAGIVAFKTGLLRPSKMTGATQMAAVAPGLTDSGAKPASLLTASAAPTAAADVFETTDAARGGRGLEADAAVLGDSSVKNAEGALPAMNPVAKAPEPPQVALPVDAPSAPPSAPVPSAPMAMPTTPTAPAATVAQAVAPVLSPAPAPAPAAAPASLDARPASTLAATTPARSSAPAQRVQQSARPVRAARVVPKEEVVATKPEKGAASSALRLKTAAASPKPVSRKVAKRSPPRDARPDAAETLTGWKLHGTWPQRGPGQLAWVADSTGKLQTVAVGQRVGGAEVLAIGKRGEMVQTTAGQIRP